MSQLEKRKNQRVDEMPMTGVLIIYEILISFGILSDI